MALLTACNGNNNFVERLLLELFAPNLEILAASHLTGNGCTRHLITVPDAALGEDRLIAAGFTRSPSLAYALEQAVGSGSAATDPVAIAQMLGATRNCFDDVDEFHMLVNETRVWVFFERSGHTVVFVSVSDRSSVHIFRG